MKSYVINHSNIDKNPLTLEILTKLLNTWLNELHLPPPDDPIWYEHWHSAYINEYYKQPSSHLKIKTQPLTNTIAFKSSDKIKALQSIYPNKNELNQTTSSYFPLKQNIKRYQLHKVAKRGSYLIDLMFVDKLCYLIAININTRYLYAVLINNIIFDDKDNDDSKIQHFSKTSKDAVTFINKLDQLIKSGVNIKHLTGDGEKAFNSDLAKAYYISHNITWHTVPRLQMGTYPDFMSKEQKQMKTDPMHGSLGIIDRVIRTIRDMAYNLQIGTITPNVMKEIVNQYNNAPHKTLSKYAGFSVSPQMVNIDPDLEEYIVRRITQENYIIKCQPGFNIPLNTQVKVYNEHDSLMKRRSIIRPGIYHVIGFNNGLYEVIDDKNNVQLIPRTKIDYYY